MEVDDGTLFVDRHTLWWQTRLDDGTSRSLPSGSFLARDTSPVIFGSHIYFVGYHVDTRVASLMRIEATTDNPRINRVAGVSIGWELRWSRLVTIRLLVDGSDPNVGIEPVVVTITNADVNGNRAINVRGH